MEGGKESLVIAAIITGHHSTAQTRNFGHGHKYCCNTQADLSIGFFAFCLFPSFFICLFYPSKKHSMSVEQVC